MMPWTFFAASLVVLCIPCLFVLLKRDLVHQLAALEVIGIVVTLVFVALSVAQGRPAYLDVALAAALVTAGSSLAFARFLERWL